MTFRDIISSATAQRTQFLLKGLTGEKSSRKGKEQLKLRVNTDEASYTDAVCLHNKTLIHTRTHTQTRVPTDVHKRQTSQECAGDAQQQSVTYSLINFSFKQKTSHLAAYKTHTMRCSHVNVDVMHYTQNTVQKVICSV